MYKIGDFSRLGQVSVRMLRHYDQLDLLKPENVDYSTGYRSYSIKQLPSLNRILFLKDLGFTLQQVKEMLANNMNIEEMKALLREKQQALEEELNQAKHRFDAVSLRLEQIENEGKEPLYEVMLKESPPLILASVRKTVPHMSQMAHYCQSMHQELYSLLKEHHIQHEGPEFTLYHDKEYQEENMDVEMGICLNKNFIFEGTLPVNLSVRNLPKEKKVASLIYKGPYEGTFSGVLALLNWVTLNDWNISGALREIQLSGPTHNDRGEVQTEPVTELQIPLFE